MPFLQRREHHEYRQSSYAEPDTDGVRCSVGKLLALRAFSFFGHLVDYTRNGCGVQQAAGKLCVVCAQAPL